MRRTLLTALAACVAVGPVLADDAAPLTIDQAVAKALHDGPAMKFANANLAAKEEERTGALRSAWPTLSADFYDMHESGEPTSFFAVNHVADPNEPPGKVSGYYGAAVLTLTVPLYQNGAFFSKNSPAAHLAGGNYDKAKSENLGQNADTANQVAKAYLNARSAIEEVELQQAAHDRLKRRLDYVRQRVQAHVATHADELLADAALASKSADLNAARRRQDLQLLQLSALLGMPRTQRPAIGKLPDEPPVLPSLEDLADQAAAGQPAVKSQEAEVEIARAQLETTRGAGSTTLSFVANSTAANSLVKDSHTPTFNSFGLKLSVPLFDGGQNNAHARAKDLEIIEQEQKLIVARDTAIQTVYAAYYAAQDAAEKIETAKKTVAQTQYLEQVSAAKFQKGFVGLDTVIQDEANALAARIELVKSRYGLWSAYADLLKSVGRPFALNPVSNVASSGS